MVLESVRLVLDSGFVDSALSVLESGIWVENPALPVLYSGGPVFETAGLGIRLFGFGIQLFVFSIRLFGFGVARPSVSCRLGCCSAAESRGLVLNLKWSRNAYN